MSKDEKYTDPELREKIKSQIQDSSKGGRKGQWSARKSQLLVQEYERQGGGYTSDERDEEQRSLERWGEQDWQTRGGDADARGEDGTRRYLPDVAWKLLTPKEREQADAAKKDADGQHVANPDAAQEALKAAELLTMTAAEARKAVNAMDSASQLRRARRAEHQFGKDRTTVLKAIENRLDKV